MAAIPKNKKPKGKKTPAHKTGKLAVHSKMHLADAPKAVGHNERLQAFRSRATELKRNGRYHWQIAQEIADEFQLASVPPITTVQGWLDAEFAYREEELLQLQIALRLSQFNELERMKAKWLELATAQDVEIQRWVKVEGEEQPVLDENAIKEQSEATKRVIEICARQAKLLGLDIQQAKDEKGEGPKTLGELQLWINNLFITTDATKGAAIDIHSEVLELKTGIEQEEDHL